MLDENQLKQIASIEADLDLEISEQSGGSVIPPNQKESPDPVDSGARQLMDAESNIQSDIDLNPLNESATDKTPMTTAITEDSNDSTNLPQDAYGFLEMIFKGHPLENWTFLSLFPSNYLKQTQQNSSTKTRWFQIKDLKTMIERAQYFNSQGYDISFLPASITPEKFEELRGKDESKLREKDPEKEIKLKYPTIRGNAMDIEFISCLKADIDVESFDIDGKPIHGQSEKLAPTFEDAFAILPKNLPPTLKN